MLNGYISRLQKTREDLLAKVGEYETAIKIAEMEQRQLGRETAGRKPGRANGSARRVSSSGNGHEMTLKQFVANVANLTAQPRAAEAQRVLDLAAAAGIQSTRGSVTQAMLALRKTQGKGQSQSAL